MPNEDYLAILGLNERPRQGDEVFQRLAVIIELERVHSIYDSNGQNWDSVTSGQPVYLDASNNGFQHGSALLRIKSLAGAVNLQSPTDENEDEQDLYQKVADDASKAFEKGTDVSIFRMMIDRNPKIFGNYTKWAGVFSRKSTINGVYTPPWLRPMRP